MNKKIIKVALIGKTNAGKSTLINKIVGEEISIINKKINTTQESVIGIKNKSYNQLIFFDTPGSNFLKTSDLNQKKFKINIWKSIDDSNIIAYLVDVTKYNFNNIKKDILKLSEVNKSIIFIFNKIDLINNKNILPFISELKEIEYIKNFFLISARYNKGLNKLINYLTSQTYQSKWIYNDNEITNNDDIYITNECTRNSILHYLNQEIPYKIVVKNEIFKFLKNKDLKIKQLIELPNKRYKGIILGKKGITIKRIREKSQKQIKDILKLKVHLYLQVIIKNDK